MGCVRPSARRTGNKPMKRALIALAISVAAAVAVSLVDPRAILVSALAGLLTAPLLVRAFRHRLDVFEPITWANAALFVMFVVRPVAHWAYGSYAFRGYDIEQSLNAALVVAAAGVASIQFGYAIPAGRGIAAGLPAAPAELHLSSTATAYALGITALGIVGFIVFPPDLGLAASAYLYNLPILVIPGALLLLAIGLVVRSPTSIVLGLLAIIGAFLVFAPSGQRLWLLLLLAPALVYAIYLRRGTRPGPVLVLVVLLTAFPVLAAARDLTSRETLGDLVESSARAFLAAPETVREFVLGPDTEMLDGLALEVQAVPRDLPYHPGHTLASLIAHPIPRALWSEKPRQAEDLLNEWFFGSVGYQVGNAGVAYSIFGGLFFDSGLPGVVLGGLACGVLLRVSWEWYRGDADSLIANLQLAATLPFAVILMRGNIQDTLSRALFVIAPILLVGLVSQRVVQRAHGRATSATA